MQLFVSSQTQTLTTRNFVSLTQAAQYFDHVICFNHISLFKAILFIYYVFQPADMTRLIQLQYSPPQKTKVLTSSANLDS